MLDDKKFDPRKLSAYGTVRKIDPGEKIIREGDAGDEMYIILQGKVVIEVGSIVVGELGSGDFFGEMSLIDKEPRSATVTASQTSLLFVINEANFERVISWEPEIAVRIMKSLSKRLRDMNQELRNIFDRQRQRP